MEINGTVHLVGQTEEVGSNGFTKRLLVVKTDEQYPQMVPMDFIKDKTSILDNYHVGDPVKVSINIRGNEYQGKYYVNLQAWRIEKNGNPQQPPIAQNQPEPSFNDLDPDNLPF